MKAQEILPVSLGELGYSADEVMARRRLCHFAVFSLFEPIRAIAKFAPADVDYSLDRMSPEQINEIRTHASSYTEQILLCEQEGSLWAFAPSIYPSSSLLAVMIFDGDAFSTAEILRLIRCDECPKIFKCSKFLKCAPARMTASLKARAEKFFELCRELQAVFCDMERLSDMQDKQAKDELVLLVLRISRMLGCPIKSLSLGDDGQKYLSTDLPLFTAFMLTYMLTAYDKAADRSVDVLLFEASDAAHAHITFDSPKGLYTLAACLEWDALTADRNMFFEFYDEDGRAHVEFLPKRHDWSLLGLKQDIKFI